MGSYGQWRTAADKGELRRVTWVCGEQRALVEEVVATTRQAVAASELDYLSFTAGVDPEPAIWAAANQYPLNPGAQRLICVRSAEKLKVWQQLERWLASGRQLPTSFLLFVSNDPDLPSDTAGGNLLRRKARLVRCSQLDEADAIAWLRRGSQLDTDTARHLLTRVGGDLSAAQAVCVKLNLFTGAASTAVIDALCDDTPAASYVDNLLAMRKREALLAATRLPERERAATIAELDQRLDLLAVLHHGLRLGLPVSEYQGVPPFLVRQYLPIAKYYDHHRCAKNRRVLAVCEEALKTGAAHGVLEALVALW